MSQPPSDKEISTAHTTLNKQGEALRRAVLGSEHVDRSLSNASAFSMPMQEMATEAGWGMIWGRPGLEKKTRSLLCLAMLTALGKQHELGAHVRGAVNNGCTVVEIRETLLQAAGYSGLPNGLEGFRVAEKVLNDMGVLEKEK